MTHGTSHPLDGPPERLQISVAQLLQWAIEITNAAAVVAVWTRDDGLFARAGSVAALINGLNNWPGAIDSEANDQQRADFAKAVDALSDHLQQVRSQTTSH